LLICHRYFTIKTKKTENSEQEDFMEFKPFKDITLSRLGMGNMRLPVQTDQPDMPIDRVKAQEIIDYAIKGGINYFDTAYIYHNGESEKFLGEALGKYPRDNYYLATKFFILTNPDYKAVFEEQLTRLKTNYIDFYMIHGIFDHTYQQYIDNGCIEYFLEQKKEGRIKYLGFSSHAGVENLGTFADHHKWDFAQIQLNYFDWRYASTKQEYEALSERNIPIMVMEPVRGGRLASLCPEAETILKETRPDWSIASWAFRWLKRLPQVQVILSGMTTLEQIQDNIVTFSDVPALTDEEEHLLMEACDIFRAQVRTPCTACRYCCDNCPVHINIPQVLSVYNRFRLEGSWALSDLDNLDSETGPTDCTGCGACTGHCPQGIDVPAIMEELSDMVRRRPDK